MLTFLLTLAFTHGAEAIHVFEVKFIWGNPQGVFIQSDHAFSHLAHALPIEVGTLSCPPRRAHAVSPSRPSYCYSCLAVVTDQSSTRLSHRLWNSTHYASPRDCI